MNTENPPIRPKMEQRGGDVLLWIKAVPGASQDQIAGLVGDRLKVRISAPPEGGKANKAICTQLAKKLGVKKSQVSVLHGVTNSEKVIQICSAEIKTIRQRLK